MKFHQSSLFKISKLWEWETSSQFINVDKSTVLFSSNTPMGMRNSIMNHLGIANSLSKDKYLGLPIMIGKSRRKEFQSLNERLWQHFNGWSSKLLSCAGKAILIQAIAQAILLYVISCFKFS